MWRRSAAIFFLFGAASVACASSTNKAAGTVCTNDSECASGACLGLSVFSDAGCEVVGKSCSQACKQDSDCASLGTNFKCFDSCNGGTSTCGAT